MRGRPAGQMTQRRKQIMSAYADEVLDGGAVSLARLARRCGLYDYREARRVVGDLKKLGAI